MSYQASYTSRLNTRIAADAIKNIGRAVFQVAGSVRTGCEKYTKVIDKLMSERSDFLVDIAGLESKYEICYNNILTSQPSLSQAERKIKALETVSELKYFAQTTDSYKLLLKDQKMLKSKEGNLIANSLLADSFSLVEKSLVDIQTLLITKAFIDCDWEIIGSAAEPCSQCIVTQDKNGNVLAANITANNISLDISGFSDSSCIKHAERFLDKLEELGLQITLDQGFRHNKPGGGILLSEGKNAKQILKKAKSKKKKAMTVSIPVYANNVNSKSKMKNSSSHKIKEV
jgi:hypothetical protein